MSMIESGGPAAGPGWTVLSQVTRMIAGPGGTPVDGVRITAQLKSPPGTTFFVDVPASQYPQAAKALLAAKAADVYSVDQLEG
jgi:hypothetical protein